MGNEPLSHGSSSNRFLRPHQKACACISLHKEYMVPKAAQAATLCTRSRSACYVHAPRLHALDANAQQQYQDNLLKTLLVCLGKIMLGICF